MKSIFGSTLLITLLSLQPLATAAQEDFAFDTFEMPLPPDHLSGFGFSPALTAPHHGAFLVNAPFDGAFSMDPMHLVMLSEQLDLTKQQRETMGKIVDEAMPKMRDLMFRMGDAREELEAASAGESKDEAELRALADNQGKLHADLLFLQLSTKQRMRAVLTEEQRAQLGDGSGWSRAHELRKALRAAKKPK